MTNLQPVDAPTPHREAEQVLNELNAALKAHGIILPSLELDHVSLFADHIRPLVALGRVNLETARRLVEVLSGAAPK